MVRKVVQVAVAPETEHSKLVTVALCDDGTVWHGYYEHGPEEYKHKWEQLPPVPQPEPPRY